MTEESLRRLQAAMNAKDAVAIAQILQEARNEPSPTAKPARTSRIDQSIDADTERVEAIEKLVDAGLQDKLKGDTD